MPTSINEHIMQRFAELDKEIAGLNLVKLNDGYEYVPGVKWQKWTTNVLGLIRQVFGTDSPHFTNFQKIYDKGESSHWELDRAKGVFYAAKEDYEGGYVFSLEANISGEVLGDFVALAKEALPEDKNVAVVLACAALEDALKRYAAANSLDVDGKSMQDVVGALKSKGLVRGAQKSLLDTMPKIRDYAMHANWNKITAPDVSSVIGFVEQFMLEHF